MAYAKLDPEKIIKASGIEDDRAAGGNKTGGGKKWIIRRAETTIKDHNQPLPPDQKTRSGS